MRHAFTVDVEDWYHGIPIAPEEKARAERRLERGLDPLLALLAKHDVRGTFYILGPVAREHPAAVRAIAAAGHEIGCHGWSHDLLYTMTPARFREETQRAREAIEDVTGAAVRSYRAAYFSVTRASWWALEELAGLGFDTDSSIFPVRNWRYGIPDFPPRPTWIETKAGSILEVPMSVRKFGRFQAPVTGGAYLRLYPYAVSRANLRAVERAGRPPRVLPPPVGARSGSPAGAVPLESATHALREPAFHRAEAGAAPFGVRVRHDRRGISR